MLVAILVSSRARIPEFAKGLGKGINEFKKASREVTDSLENESAASTAPKAPPANTTAQAPQVPVPSKPPETKVI